MSSTNSAMFNVVDDIGINSMPVDMSSCQMCHFPKTLVAVI